MLNRFSDFDGATQDERTRLVDLLTALTEDKALRQCLKDSTRFLNIKLGDKVFDAGCGLGNEVRHFSAFVGKEGQVVGVDSSAEMISIAEKRKQSENERYRCENIYQLSDSDDSYDVVYVGRVLHHLEKPKEALGELLRILKPGGRIGVVEPDFGGSFVHPYSECITPKLLNCVVGSVKDGRAGRKLRSYLRTQQLRDIMMRTYTHQYYTLEALCRIIPIDRHINFLSKSFAKLAKEILSYQQVVQEADNDGSFFFSWPVVAAYAVKQGYY